MEKVNVTRVNYKSTDKNGQTLISQKSGKPYFKVGIQAREYGTVWINGLTPFPPDKWENTEQELEITDDPKWGKQFKLPSRAPQGISRDTDIKLDKIYQEVYATRQEMVMIRQLLQQSGALPKQNDNYPQSTGPTAFDEEDDADISPEDIPW